MVQGSRGLNLSGPFENLLTAEKTPNLNISISQNSIRELVEVINKNKNKNLNINIQINTLNNITNHYSAEKGSNEVREEEILLATSSASVIPPPPPPPPLLSFITSQDPKVISARSRMIEELSTRLSKPEKRLKKTNNMDRHKYK